MDNGGQDSNSVASRFGHRLWWLWAALVVGGGGALWTRHETHLLQVLPYLVLLACPLMHRLVHHHGHGHGHAGDRREPPPATRDG